MAKDTLPLKNQKPTTFGAPSPRLRWPIPTHVPSFGSMLPGRSYQTTTYKYGFNGKENDNELTSNTGTHLDFGARIYDSRLGRFLSIDRFTFKFPYHSPYSPSNNSPISFIDAEGDSIYFVVGKEILGFAKDIVLMMKNGKEIWEEFANSSTQNVYLSIGNISGLNSNGLTIQDIPSRLIDGDGKVNFLNDYNDPEIPKELLGSPTPTEIEFSKGFDGLVVNPSKKNSFVIIGDNLLAPTVATVLHELKAHSCENCNHETFGNEFNFFDQPGGNSKGSIAEKLYGELKVISESPEFKEKERKFNNQKIPKSETEIKSKSKQQ